MTVNLRGLCWDHPRCIQPTAAATAVYRTLRPDVTIRWSARPLAKFNDEPPWEVADDYDLIFVDHPVVGAAAERGALLALDTVLPAQQLARFEADSIGATHRSYAWGHHQWALGVDAACQVAAVHDERLSGLGAVVPRTWEDVLTLAKSAPGSVALPLNQSDALCTLISLSANACLAAGDTPTWLRREAVEVLVELSGLVDPSCFHLDPPQVLAAMMRESRVAYVPFVFGYANLARAPLSFVDVAGVDGQPHGSILGGAGLSVSSRSRHPEEAAAFAAWCMDPSVQRHLLLPAGGQPGNRLMWSDGGTSSSDQSDFFSATRRSIEHAYVRPRDPWWPSFQSEAGLRLESLLRTGGAAARIVSELEELAARHHHESGRP